MRFAVMVAVDRMLLHVPEVLLIPEAGIQPKKPRPQSVLTWVKGLYMALILQENPVTGME